MWTMCQQAHRAIAPPEDSHPLVGNQRQFFRLGTDGCLEMVDANKCSVFKNKL